MIFIHGYGADGADLLGLAAQLSPALPDTLFVAPDAPSRCSMNPSGFQWFPIPRMDGSSELEASDSFKSSKRELKRFVEGEMEQAGVSEERTVLVGFSQGTMMALSIAPVWHRPLAGVVGFSGALLEPEGLGTDCNSRPPVLLVHGDMDDVIPVAALESARTSLQDAGFDVRSFVSRGVGHGIAPDGLTEAQTFIRERIGQDRFARG